MSGNSRGPASVKPSEWHSLYGPHQERNKRGGMMLCSPQEWLCLHTGWQTIDTFYSLDRSVFLSLWKGMYELQSPS